MNQQFRNRQIYASNPLANILVVIVGIVVISLSLALGFVVFVGIACFMLIMAAVVTVRVWWLKRRLGLKTGGKPVQSADTQYSRRVIEGEYREVRPPADKDPKI